MHRNDLVLAPFVVMGLMVASEDAMSQTQSFSTSEWCGTANTICWDTTTSFSGVRLALDLAVSHTIQFGDNRFEFDGLEAQPKFVADVNLAQGWISLQTGFIAPGSVRIDDGSPLRAKFAQDPGNLDFTVGWTVGLSFFNGAVSVGYGRLSYDLRGIPLAPGAVIEGHDAADGFMYFSLQAVQNLLNALSKD